MGRAVEVLGNCAKVPHEEALSRLEVVEPGHVGTLRRERLDDTPHRVVGEREDVRGLARGVLGRCKTRGSFADRSAGEGGRTGTGKEYTGGFGFGSLVVFSGAACGLVLV